ncbi:MAG: hypothetical protein C4532_18175 [Candidatus Abyssobacteria bacterium SURF_17]|uniref:Uncharacterized protein n=1 Tax=Candidatus Abyssobacteria bacterium SURF_17 TaxID=2093361 RepID=A0A419EPK9_9BACT|nr:MAG: hypothetical protein C4532_18175 [Candidatus Abyssubacteria bacterium SURF_17]
MLKSNADNNAAAAMSANVRRSRSKPARWGDLTLFSSLAVDNELFIPDPFRICLSQATHSLYNTSEQATSNLMRTENQSRNLCGCKLMASQDENSGKYYANEFAPAETRHKWTIMGKSLCPFYSELTNGESDWMRQGEQVHS